MKTTREAAKEESHKEKVNSLQELLEKNYDSEKGYKKAIEDAKSVQLKKFLKEQAVMRNHFATEIDRILHGLNEKPREKGSATGSLHRAWIDVKTMFAGKGDDEAVLEECLRGDKASIKEYEEKLKKTKFSPQNNEILQNQLNKIKLTVSKIKRLEDLAG